MDTKPFYQSITFWFNALFVLIGVAGVFGFGSFQPSAEVSEVAAIIMAIANIIMRFRTKIAIR
jgi:hypothetical protein